MNKGGTLISHGIAITMVHALHTSSITEGDQDIYAGDPAGFIIRFENGFTLYHAGDTGVFGDMKIDLSARTFPPSHWKPLHYGSKGSDLCCKTSRIKVCDPNALWNFSSIDRHSRGIYEIDERSSPNQSHRCETRRNNSIGFIILNPEVYGTEAYRRRIRTS